MKDKLNFGRKSMDLLDKELAAIHIYNKFIDQHLSLDENAYSIHAAKRKKKDKNEDDFDEEEKDDFYEEEEEENPFDVEPSEDDLIEDDFPDEDDDLFEEDEDSFR
jgi:hypothetical protein